jgi:protein TonB
MSRNLFQGSLISIVLHGGVVCALASAGATLSKTPPPLVIDFSINETLQEVVQTQQVPMHQEPVPMEPLPQVDTKEFKEMEFIEPEPLVAIADTSQHRPPPAPKKQFRPKKIPRLVALPPTSAGVQKDTAAKKVSAQEHYIKANFAYIKDAVQLKTRYPGIARRMGWQGKVLLSFIINTNGHIEDIRIVKSCGFKALDKNAVDTVKRCAPFPKPMARAKLTLPVTYRLN